MNRHFRRLVAVIVVFVIFGAGLQPAHAGSGKILWSVEGVKDLPTIDPAKSSLSQSFLVVNFLFAHLVKLDANLKVTGDLAASWVISGGGTIYTFTLHDSKFSDGSPITADDIIYSLDYAFDPKVGGSNAAYYLNNISGVDDFVNGKTTTIAGVTAPDPKTVVIKLSGVSAVFLDQLTFGFNVISKAQASSDPDWAKHPVTSGAFQIKEWKANESMSIIPNPGYFAPPTLDEIDFLFIEKSETAYRMYESGQLDIMGSQQNGIPVAFLPAVKGRSDFKQAASFATQYIGFNNKIAPFDNVDVRRAFAQAIDKKRLATTGLTNTVYAADRILPPGMPGTDLAIKPLAFSVAAAKASLAKAGFTPASLPPITITYGDDATSGRVMAILAAMWKDNLGVTVKLQAMPVDKFSDALNATYKTPETGLQAYESIWGADYPDPQNFLSQQLHTDVGNNNGHWSDTTFDTVVDRADVITNDDTTRFQLYQQAEQIAIDEVGWLPIFNPKLNVLIRNNIGGVVINGNGIATPDFSLLKGHS